MSPQVSVIIVSYNNVKQIDRCLSALAAQTFHDFEAIIIDNASSDGTADHLRLPDARFRLVRNGENRGFAAANNQGALLAAAAWLATLNPDAYAEEDWLSTLLAAAEGRPDVAMLGSTQISAADPRRLDGTGDCLWLGGLYWRADYGAPLERLPQGLDEAFSPCAAAALWRRRDFLEVGGFDEDFFCYGEDVDLGFRLRLRGWRGLQVHAARIRHEGYGSASRRGDFVVYHGMRNRTWVFVKNMPLALIPVALPLHAALVSVLLLRDMAAGRGAASARGLWHALTRLGPILAKRRRIQAERRIGWRGLLPFVAVNPLVAMARARHARQVTTDLPPAKPG
jgi:N-acetylglucosaminyl-diphospho-decaprenol L-rhamnosyltransferase